MMLACQVRNLRNRVQKKKTFIRSFWGPGKKLCTAFLFFKESKLNILFFLSIVPLLFNAKNFSDSRSGETYINRAKNMITPLLARLFLFFLLIQTSVGQDSVYFNGDLILVNPQQSTAIFLVVIASSTILEFCFEKAGEQRNIYIRTIVRALKEELTVISTSQLILLFVAYSFSMLSSLWRFTLEWVVLTLAYLCLAYAAGITTILILLKWRSLTWRTFEWARIEADAHHSNSEQLFKIARLYFADEVSSRANQHGTMHVEIPLVAYSSFLSRVERSLLKYIMDFSMKTWGLLSLIIIVNGARSLTVGTIDTTNVGQITSFVIVIGYVPLLVYLAVHRSLERRLRQFILRQRHPESRVEGATGLQCLFFRSPIATLEVFKAFLLIMMWYSAVFISGFVYVSYHSLGYFAVIVYAIGAVPPIVTCFSFPWTINVVTMCVSLGTELDKAVDHLKNGVQVDDDIASEDSDDELGSVDAHPNNQKKLKKKKEGGGNTEEMHTTTSKARGNVAASALSFFPDEYNGPPVTFHDGLPEDQVPPGEPSRIMGVVPVNAMASRKKWIKKTSRPIFET